MPLMMETALLALLAYAFGLAIGWMIWGLRAR